MARPEHDGPGASGGQREGASDGTRKVSWDALSRSAEGEVRRMIHLATKCVSEDDFIARFSSFATENSLALPSKTEMAVGDTGRFLITLKDQSPIMRGKCEVVEVRPSKKESDGVIVRVRLLHMDERSRAVHARLMARRKGAGATIQRPLDKNFDAEVTAVPTGDEHTDGGQSPGSTPRPPGKSPGAEFAAEVPTRPGERKLELVRANLPPPVPLRGGAAATRAESSTPVSPIRAAPLPARQPASMPFAKGGPASPMPSPLPALRSAPAVPSATVASVSEDATRSHQRSAAVEEEAMLPANPFGDLKTDALGSFVECTIYEEYSTPRGEFEPPPVRGHRKSWIPPELAVAAGVTPSPVLTPSPMPALATAPEAVLDPDESLTSPFIAPGNAVAADDALPTRLSELRRRWATLSPFVRRFAPLAAAVVGGLVLGALLFGGRPPAQVAAPVAVVPAPPITPVSGAPDPALGEAEQGPRPLAPVRQPIPPSAPVGSPRAATSAPAVAAAPAASPSTPAGTGECVANVITQPEDARVFWGTRELGRTPIEGQSVACGKAEVAIRHERYQPVVRVVDAQPGEPVVVSQRLIRPRAEIVLTSNPKGAAVIVNARPVGQTPIKVAVWRYETVEVSVTKAGYKPWKQRIYVREESKGVTVDLESLTNKNKTGAAKTSSPAASPAPPTFKPKPPKF